jgi:flagellar biogenesis protein FliO
MGMSIIFVLISLALAAAFLGFIGWLIYRVVKGELKVRQIKAHNIAYGLSVVAGIFTYAFFLSMDMPQLIKILVSIILGVALIFLAAYIQRRRQQDKPTIS